MFDYRNDVYGRACLREAEQSKAPIGFGAVLVKHRRVIGRGHNRRAQAGDRGIISHVDYAVHAEQAAFLDAVRNGHCPEKLAGCRIYVLGIVAYGPARGTLTVRDQRVFICRRCPRSVFIPFRVSVCVPCVHGWALLSPEQAMQTAETMCGHGYWKKFAQKTAAR